MLLSSVEQGLRVRFLLQPPQALVNKVSSKGASKDMPQGC